MKLKFIDTHCHVHFQAYAHDMAAVIERSLEAGVGMITVGTQSTTSKKGIEVAGQYPGVWCTIGLHPNHIHVQDFFDDNELPPGVKDDLRPGDGPAHIKTRSENFDWEYYQTLVSHPKVVAIGEFGLDYYRLPPGVDLEKLKQDQKLQAEQQLKFASQFAKPIVIHCRDGAEPSVGSAHADQIELLQTALSQNGLARRGVIHCFTGTAEEAARYWELGFSVSIGGIVTFGKNVMAAVEKIPLEQILLETDAPYLTPAPHRGKRNEPRFVEFVAQKIADIKGVSVDQVAEITTQNALDLFQLHLT
jgi:TatD DNase family protein